MKTRTYVNAAVLAAGFAGLALALRPSPGLAQDAATAEEARGSETGRGRRIVQAAKNNALIQAIDKVHPDRALRLIQAGADVETAGASGRTMLMLAAALGLEEAVEFLIEHGVDLGTEAAEESLRIAVERGYFGLVALLLDEGVDPGAVDLP